VGPPKISRRQLTKEENYHAGKRKVKALRFSLLLTEKAAKILSLVAGAPTLLFSCDEGEDNIAI